MSDRPTPETDAAEYLISVGRKNDEWLVQSDFARKLERERDEAREQTAMWKANHDNQVSLKAMLMDRPDLGDRASRIAELIRERDEAREKYDNLATENMLAINKLCNERDEARAISQQLVHIASHCLGRHDNTNPETITEAINRWNAATKK
jgi:hypothetical protein